MYCKRIVKCTVFGLELSFKQEYVSIDAVEKEAPSTPEPILDPSIPFEPKEGQTLKDETFIVLCSICLQAKDVLVVISKAGGAAPPRPPVTSERVTVTGPGTGVSMMVTPGAGETWCVGQITASSSGLIIMKRTTVVRSLQ